MSEDIVTFQVQLSSIMEMVLKAAVHEITCLVEGCFQGEVARSRKEVETLKQKLLLSERKWRSQEHRVRAKCVECGRAGVSTEETDPVPTGTESDEAGAKEKNNLGGGWNIVPFIVLDTEKAAVSVIRGQETTDHEDNLDIIHKGEVLKETKRLNDALKVVNEVIAPGRNESPTEPDLRKSEKEWDSTERNPVDVVVQALKAEPRDVHVSPNTALNKLQNETQSGHVKPELGTFNADFHISDNFYHVVQHNLSSEPSCSTIDVRDAFQGISCPMTPKRPNLNQSRIQSENEEDLVMHVPYDVGLWIPPDKNTENYISTNITENQQLCPYCQYTTSNLADLHVHLQSHSAEKHYTLSQLQTASPRGFHTKRQMDPRQDSAFSSYDGKKSRRNLERHPSLHRAGALHSCSECGKTFTRAYSLKIHHRSHTGERPYHCTHCKKGFISPTDLRRHKRIHTGEKPYTCMLCGRNFSYSCSLKKHQRIHTQEKPHCCIQCGKGFRCSGHLSTHMRIHTGEKPYACLLCGSKFSQSWTLKMHQRIHTQEKPHCCIQCGKSFRCSGDLSKHLRIHTGEKPYICNSCGKRYSQSQSLKSHKCLSDFKHTVNVN